jgi:hypothetical protein
MRVVLILLAMALQAACSNRVISNTPWFTLADETGAPPLRPGVWVVHDTSESKCRFNERAPVERWPSCAHVLVVRPNEMLGLDRTQSDDRPSKTSFEWSTEAYILAAGSPRIVQNQDCHPDPSPTDAEAVSAADPPIPKPAAEKTVSEAGDDQWFCYFAVKPTAFDAQGRIIAYLTWPILCGPPPPPSKPGESDEGDTLAPFPGLHLRKGNCTADNADVVRAAAKASEAIAADESYPVNAHKIVRPWPSDARWIRDGER